MACANQKFVSNYTKNFSKSNNRINLKHQRSIKRNAAHKNYKCELVMLENFQYLATNQTNIKSICLENSNLKQIIFNMKHNYSSIDTYKHDIVL